ncbi:MAG TPA: HIG1 domain-containing protein [Burkholderiales bacterium]|nr:HIG1 domain-containing protein [Burkholderiales bacterium]
MELLTVLVLAAALGAAYALAAGIIAMARNGEVAHLSSKSWMAWRVRWQAIAVVLIIVGAIGTAASTASRERDCVYDYQMMTNTECHTYREKILTASSGDERLALREELHRVLDERARGAPATNWRLRK